MDPPTGQVLGKGGGHLGAAGVVNAHEQQLRDRCGGATCGLGVGEQLVTGMSFDQDRKEVPDPGLRFQDRPRGGDRGGGLPHAHWEIAHRYFRARRI